MMTTKPNLYNNNNLNKTFITEDIFQPNTINIGLFGEYLDPRMEALTGRL